METETRKKRNVDSKKRTQEKKDEHWNIKRRETLPDREETVRGTGERKIQGGKKEEDGDTERSDTAESG